MPLGARAFPPASMTDLRFQSLLGRSGCRVLDPDGRPMGDIVCTWDGLGQPVFGPDFELRRRLGRFAENSLSAAQSRVSAAYRRLAR